MERPRSDIGSLLRTTGHRPWPVPAENWIWYQEWLAAVFLHWSYPASSVQPLLPKGVTLDLFEGRAWVSMVAFTMHRVHPKGLWPMPGLSSFAELNVRTYVLRDGKPGVYFPSIEAGNPVACWLARLASPLPYRFRRMRQLRSGDDRSFEVGHPSDDRYCQMKFRMGGALETKSELDLWLTERYCLYADIKDRLYRADVHHRPWPLHEVDLKSFDCRYSFPGAIELKEKPELCHYSPGVPILAWGQKLL